MKKVASLLFGLFLIIGIGGSAAAQFTVSDTGTLKKGEFLFGGYPLEYKLDSKLMGREIPYIVVVPNGYSGENNDERYPVIYLLHGLTGHFDNWTEKTDIAKYASTNNIILVMPEGGDGWYTDSAAVANDKYESYIIEELLPEIDKKFRTIGIREKRAIAGLSMGGYGALKFGLKYPELFSVVGSFSGAFDAPMRGIGGAKTWPSIMSVYGKGDSETRKANDIFARVGKIAGDDIAKLPFIYLDCGTEDFLFETNRRFADLLIEKKVPHEFRQLPGGHTWPYWEKQAGEFVELAMEKFATMK